MVEVLVVLGQVVGSDGGRGVGSGRIYSQQIILPNRLVNGLGQ